MSKTQQNETTEPLYRRDTAPVDRADDLILLVLDATDEPLTPEQVFSRVTEVAREVFETEVNDRNGQWECNDAIDRFQQLDYVNGSPFLPGETELKLAEKGRLGCEALRAGLSDEERGALEEWSENNGGGE